MNQRRARKERRERREQYEWLLRQWELAKPSWWRIFSRMRWKANKPKYVRR